MRKINYLFLILITALFAANYGRLIKMQTKQNKMYVILTGGPGGGKSSILIALRNRGFSCVDEVARDLIQREVATNGDQLPWKNKEKFRDAMFEKQLKVYQAVNHDGVVFFDRGLIDCLAYSQLIDIEIPKRLDLIARDTPFHSIVFATPPWEDIYQNDQERKQSFEEAVETCDKIVKYYKDYGYHVIDLPKVDVEKRVDFILDTLGIHTKD